jgi:1-acyl-sn-glycerol-3-phosphate acyltransferase
MGFLLRRLNTYPVSGSASDLTSFKILCKLLKEGKKVAVFPEGARAFDGKLQPLQTGTAMLALRCQCPVVPTIIKGAYEVYPRDRHYPKPWGKTTCIFGEPLYPEAYAHLDKKIAQAAMTKDLERALLRLQD